MRHRLHPAPDPRHSEREPPAADPLAGLGNQALARLLTVARKAAPKPTRTKATPIADLYASIDADEWKQAIAGGQSLLPLYADLATQLGATFIRDIKGTAESDINTALTWEGDRLRPGLNFVSRLGGKGKCGYLYDGKLRSKLPVSRTGPLPPIAVCLGPKVFVQGNKAFALATLRHELEHAAHNQIALDWLQKWRDDRKAEKAKTDFRTWLKSQPIAGADLALIRERIDDSNVNTELLSHLEGFITAFPHENRATVGRSRPVYEQLWGVVDHWASADGEVQKEAVARLLELKGRLQGADLTAFVDTMKRLKAEKQTPPALVDPLI